MGGSIGEDKSGSGVEKQLNGFKCFVFDLRLQSHVKF